MVSSPPGSSGPRAAHFLASRSFLLALVLICSTVGGGLAGAIVARVVGPRSDVDPTAAAGVGFGATDLPGMIARIAPGVVAIEVTSTGIDAGGRSISEQVAGSGFVMDADGMIATNAHVVDGATSITVVFSDGAHVAGRIVGVDRTADLAVVRVSRRALEPLVMDQGGPVRV
ncbi:MAG: trypsin-like peptidase domain-containing protein, partial [Actinomycetes bacterium]